MPKMSTYIKIFKVGDGDKDKINKLMPFRKDDKKVLEKHTNTCTKIEDFKNIELNALPVYDDRFITNNISTHGDKVYANFRDLKLPMHDIECESFTVISFDFLVV